MATRNHQQQQQQKPAQEHLAKQVGTGRSTSSKTNTKNNTTQEKTMTNTATTLKMIPLSQLFRSALNVRKSGSGDVSELAASIEAQGLIQNLVVTPEKKGKREGQGVVAGGRRLEALALLAKEGRGGWQADSEVACRVVERSEAIEISTAENVVREAMHPADEFEAYDAMVKAGKTAEQVAARFGVTVKHVEQRMKLAGLSPKIIEAYRAGNLDLDDVMAYTLTDDRKKQESMLKAGFCDSWRIRNELTKATVTAGDRRVLFIGEADYVAAGGIVTGDMFSEDRNYHSLDLLDTLTAEKLQKRVDKLAKEFPWVDVEPRANYRTKEHYTRDLPSTLREATHEEAEQLAALENKLAALELQTEADDVDETVYEQWRETEKAITAHKNARRVPHPEAAALVGAVVLLNDNGKVETMRGVMRKSDADRLLRAAKVDKEGEPVAEGDPNAVRIDLSAHATAVAQVQMANNVPVALRVLAAQLAASLLFRGWDSGVEIGAKDGLGRHRSAVEGTEVGAQLEAIEKRWEALLPETEGELLAWCLQADDDTVNALLAYVTSRTINGVQEVAGTKKSAAPFLAAMGVNMADHWTPNAGYFARIRKPATLAALADHGHTGPELSKMKRDALAASAAGLLQGTGWLPPTLR